MIYKVIFNISFFQPWFRQFKRYCCCFQSDKWKPKKSFVSPAQCNSFTQLKSKGWWTTKCAENMTFIYRLMFYLSRRVMWTFWPGPRQRTSGQEKQWIKHSMNSLSFFLILSLSSDIRQRHRDLSPGVTWRDLSPGVTWSFIGSQEATRCYRSQSVQP